MSAAFGNKQQSLGERLQFRFLVGLAFSWFFIGAVVVSPDFSVSGARGARRELLSGSKKKQRTAWCPTHL